MWTYCDTKTGNAAFLKNERERETEWKSQGEWGLWSDGLKKCYPCFVSAGKSRESPPFPWRNTAKWSKNLNVGWPIPAFHFNTSLIRETFPQALHLSSERQNKCYVISNLWFLIFWFDILHCIFGRFSIKKQTNQYHSFFASVCNTLKLVTLFPHRMRKSNGIGNNNQT